jgi:hypothetical protein
MSAVLHWAAEHIGKPYRKGGEGPDSFDCWGFVRFVFRTQYGIEMPPVQVGRAGDEAETNVAAIKRAAQVSGWRPSEDSPPQDRDIALMDSAEGRHVGVMTLVDGSVRLLHCMDPVGVCCQSHHEAHIAGFWGFEYWRHA